MRRRRCRAEPRNGHPCPGRSLTHPLARASHGRQLTPRFERTRLEADLGADVESLSTPARASRYGDLSRMNGVWGSAHSATVHARLGNDPSEWHNYHRLYRAARLTWDVVPALVFAEWLSVRTPGQRIADLGCGEMLLADAVLPRAAASTDAAADIDITVAERHLIDGYDHVAHDDRVIVADISHVAAETGSYDYVVLCLALMGANHTDYVREAHRLLHTDGQLWLL